jgi:lysophospholipase L1-like esterase
VRGVVVAGGVLLAGELALRAFVADEALLLSWERSDSVVVVDPATGALTVRPGSREATNDGPYRWEARVNGQGFRADVAYAHARTPGVPRWLLLGDSWAYGVATRQEKGLAARLEGALAARMEVPRVEVVNAGVPGASAWDVRRRWEAVAPQLELDGVVLKIPANTGSPAARAARLAARAPTSRIVQLLRRGVLTAQAGRGDPLRAQGGLPDEEALAEVRALVAAIRARGLPVVALVAPRDLAQAQDAPEELDAAWSAWTEALAPTGAWIAGHALTERSCFGWVDVSHPSERGASVLAEVVADAVALARWWPVLRGRPTPSCDDAPDALGPDAATDRP